MEERSLCHSAFQVTKICQFLSTYKNSSIDQKLEKRAWGKGKEILGQPSFSRCPGSGPLCGWE